MSGLRVVAVLIAAMWLSTAVAAGQGREVWNPPEARQGKGHAGKHGGQAHGRGGSGHHVTHRDRGHAGKPAIHAKSKDAAASAVKSGHGHAKPGSGARRASLTHSDPRSHKARSSAPTARHAGPHASATRAGAQHAHQVHAGTAHSTRQQAPAHSAAASVPERAKPAAALPVPDQKPAIQASSAPAAQPLQPAIAQPQALPPILH
jgi:hypothetical protein